MPNILLTGVSTLDIINQVSAYPAEDSEVRALSQMIRTGGNATNTAIVLQQLGLQTSLLVNRADDDAARLISTQLQARQINTCLCPTQSSSSTPTSYITLNQFNGSRTIVHHRDLDELDSHYFLSLDLRHFDWLHFEARNCVQMISMLKHAKSFNIPVSIELEKPRDGIDDVMSFADVLLVSRPFAESRGFNSATSCLDYFSSLFPNKIISCTWGDQGAWLYKNSTIIHQAATPLITIVESLGAGDTFNAGLIASLLRDQDIAEALKFACNLASAKCQQIGFDELPTPINY